MKLLILSFFYFVSLSSFGESYIIKLKKNKSLRKSTTRAFDKVKSLNLSYGSFYLASSSQKMSLSEIKRLKNHPSVEYIERNSIFSVEPLEVEGEKVVPKTKRNYFRKQWGLSNKAWFGKRGEDINALRAWKKSKGSKKIKIAVIDTGIDWSHPDLKDNMDINEVEFNGKDGVDDDGNGFVDDVYGYDFVNKDGDPRDDQGHGTHCAGIIAASHNSFGIKGVMANASLFGVKFLASTGSGTLADAVMAINYAVDRGADILSNSWGGGPKTKSLVEAIEYAKSKGVVFVAAAGNNFTNIDRNPVYPASYKVDNIITVGSMSERGKKSLFSNYGKKSVHVFAPGSRIFSTIKGGKYKSLSGTSMAAPFVSGAIGLLLSENPKLTLKQIRAKIIKAGKSSNSALAKYSMSGRLDAAKLLR